MRFKSTLANAIHRKQPNLKPIGQPMSFSHPHLFPGSSNQLTPGINISEYKQRRSKLANMMERNSMAVIAGYGLRYATGAGIFYPFHQNNDFLYLTGFNEADAAMVLKRVDDSLEFTLFVKPSDRHSEVWDGFRSSLEGATSHFGAHQSYSISDFPAFIKQELGKKTRIYTDLEFNSDIIAGLQESNNLFGSNHAASSPKSDTSISRIIRDALIRKSSAVNKENIKPLSPLIQKLRLFKSADEINVMKKAAEIAGQGFGEASHGGISEQMIQAHFEFEIKKRGADSLAYVPVVAGGTNALIIHYVANKQLVCDGQLVLVDAGAEYGGYVSDITRTWPVNGKFSTPQRLLYEAVLRTNEASIAKCREGVSLDTIHYESVVMLHRECQVLFKRPVSDAEMNALYPHHISHYLGMDVHDTFSIPRSIPLKPGMVVTVEPGLYIPNDPVKYGHFAGIGVRIEDDVLVGENGPVVLTGAAPKQVDEIEAIMQR